MEFLSRPCRPLGRVGILPGTFNPPTLAHLSLADTALAELDAVVLVLPRVFPHKSYEGASFAQRIEMMLAAIAGRPCLAAAASDSGLFVEIAQECRAACGPEVPLTFVCGRDAAERMVTWDYGYPDAISSILESFQLLVACRGGSYEPPAHLRRRIRALQVPAELDAISASDVRRRVAAGQPWQHLVPTAIVPMVRAIYRPLE
jgi:nicotinate-nucleotide adenylyltransferase